MADRKNATVRWRNTVAAVISASRKDADVRQEDLAQRLGWSRWKLAKIEAGEGKIEFGELVLLARALKIEPETLFRRMLRWD